MHDIKVFNEKLNCSYNQQERYEYWSSYREELTEILGNVDIAGKDILILGAGNLNDIDIKELSEKAKNITLLDIDSNSVVTGIKRCNLNTDRFNVVELDLTSLDKTNFMDNFKKSITNLETNEFFESYSNFQLEYNLGKHDVILILPIYTQILFHQMLTIIDQNSRSGNDIIINKSLSFVANLIGKINDKVIASLNKDGVLISASDVLEYSFDSKDVEFLRNNIKYNNVIEEFYEKYLNQYGYSLGSYGIHDIEMKLKAMEERFLIWEFDKKRKFLVKIVVTNSV